MFGTMRSRIGVVFALGPAILIFVVVDRRKIQGKRLRIQRLRVERIQSRINTAHAQRPKVRLGSLYKGASLSYIVAVPAHELPGLLQKLVTDGVAEHRRAGDRAVVRFDCAPNQIDPDLKDCALHCRKHAPEDGGVKLDDVGYSGLQTDFQPQDMVNRIE